MFAARTDCERATRDKISTFAWCSSNNWNISSSRPIPPRRYARVTGFEAQFGEPNEALTSVGAFLCIGFLIRNAIIILKDKKLNIFCLQLFVEYFLILNRALLNYMFDK